MSFNPIKAALIFGALVEKRLIEMLQKQDESKALFDCMVKECGMDAKLSEQLYRTCNNHQRNSDLHKRIAQCYAKGAADKHEVLAIQEASYGLFTDWHSVWAEVNLKGPLTWDELLTRINIHA